MCSFLRGTQRSFSFCSPLESGQGFTAHFRKARIGMRIGESSDGGTELVDDLECSPRITEGLGEFRARIPDEPLPDCRRWGVRTRCSSEDGLGAYCILLCQEDESKEPGY